MSAFLFFPGNRTRISQMTSNASSFLSGLVGRNRRQRDEAQTSQRDDRQRDDGQGPGAERMSSLRRRLDFSDDEGDVQVRTSTPRREELRDSEVDAGSGIISIDDSVSYFSMSLLRFKQNC
jgi:hypothetical protein